MAFPFGGHPNLATYIKWFKDTHQGKAESGLTTDAKGKSHTLERLSLPDGRFVVVVDLKQSECLVPSMVGYLDRRLGIKSPWFSVEPSEPEGSELSPS